MGAPHSSKVPGSFGHPGQVVTCLDPLCCAGDSHSQAHGEGKKRELCGKGSPVLSLPPPVSCHVEGDGKARLVKQLPACFARVVDLIQDKAVSYVPIVIQKVEDPNDVLL